MEHLCLLPLFVGQAMPKPATTQGTHLISFECDGNLSQSDLFSGKTKGTGRDPAVCRGRDGMSGFVKLSTPYFSFIPSSVYYAVHRFCSFPATPFA